MTYAKKEKETVTLYSSKLKLPKAYNGIRNFRSSNIKVLNDNGFYEVEDAIISQYQKRGALYFDTDIFKYLIIDFTQEEIEAEDDYQTDAETDRIIQDGVELHSDIRRRIVRAHKKGNLTDAQIATIKTFLKPAIEPLKDGDWIDAQALVNALPIPGNSTLLAVLSEVKNLINTYIIDNNIII